MTKPAIDLTGQTFGMWRVLRRSPHRTLGQTCYWLCECSGCGITKPVSSKDMRMGKTTACQRCAQRSLMLMVGTQAQALLKAGLRYKEVAQKIGVTESTLFRWRQVMGWRRTRKGRATKNEVGNQYGKLMVVQKLGTTKSGAALFRCVCECGSNLECEGYRLRRGDARKACRACLQKERMRRGA